MRNNGDTMGGTTTNRLEVPNGCGCEAKESEPLDYNPNQPLELGCEARRPEHEKGCEAPDDFAEFHNMGVIHDDDDDNEPNPRKGGKIRPINISQLNYGYVVKIDCHSFAISTKEALIKAITGYINNPNETEKHWWATEEI